MKNTEQCRGFGSWGYHEEALEQSSVDHRPSHSPGERRPDQGRRGGLGGGRLSGGGHVTVTACTPGVARPPPEPPRPGLPVEGTSATGLGLTPSGRASSSCDDARKGPAPSEAASRGSGAPGGGGGAASGPGHVGRAAEVVTHVHTRGRAVKGKVVVLLSQSAVLMNRITCI